jgi:PKD repeat protein
MKKILLFSMVLLFGWSSLQAQYQRVKGIPQNYDVISNEPVKAAPLENYFDGFEDYADFSINFSPWSLIDLDGSETYGFDGIDFNNEYAPMSFIIFNPAQTNPVMTDDPIQPHSGSKYAACFASVTPPNNDWIISQTADLGTNSSLSFWVKSYTAEYGLERYRVGISTTGTNPDDFTIISTGSYLEAPADAWQQKTFDLSQFNGQTIRVGIHCVSNDAFIFMLDDMEITTDVAEGGTLTGQVTDAFNGQPIAGAEVSVAGLSAITDNGGNYTIENIPAGMLNADFLANVTSGEAPLAVNFTDASGDGTNTVTCSKPDYITYINNNITIPQGGSLTLNISLSPTLATGQMRFVINWGAEPTDLDSHLNTPEIEGATHHVYFSNPGSATSAPYAALDHDITTGYGPETITIYDFFSGTYQYYIYNYSGSPAITTSQCVVQIYNDAGLMQTLQIPTSGTGRYWYVCDVNGSTSQLTIHNVIQENAPGSTKQEVYPPKPQPEKDVVSWLWNFGDGTTSTLQNPSHTYMNAGVYTVSLTVGNGTTTDTETKTDFINVTGPAGTGSLTGMVTDALTGEAIEGAEVSVAGLSDLTDAEGNYLIENVPIGTLSANFNANPTNGLAPLLVNFFDQSTENSSTVTCSKADYNTYSNNQVVIPQDGTLTLNISLSPTLASGQMRFVLNWGADPRDLDSHLNTPEIEGNTYHIYYSDQGSIETAPYAALDHDITSGYGPETMTIYDMFAGTYQYYIYKYAGDGPITASQAVVQIYGQNGLLQTLQVPTNGEGDYWYVCDVNGSTGQLTIRNVIQANAPGNTRFEMPEKTRNPLTITSWSWNFGDGATSTLQNPTHTYTVNGFYTVSLTVTDNNGLSQTETKQAFIQVGGNSIDESGEQQLKIYPQPAGSSLTIESKTDIIQLTISDLNGRVMLQQSLQTKNITLETGFLKQGIYLLMLQMEEGIVVRKITVR